MESRQALLLWGESSQKYQNREHKSPVLALQSICPARGYIAPRHWGTALSIYSTYQAKRLQTTGALHFCMEGAYTRFKEYLKKEKRGSSVWFLVSYVVSRNPEKRGRCRV